MSAARILLLSALLLAAGRSPAQQGGDLQAQILYAYHTEDGNRLASLALSLGEQVKADPGDASLRYHLAHAQYRRGLLSAAQGHESQAAFADCIEELKPLVKPDVKSVEALALQSACYSSLAGQKKFESALLRARAEERLKTALELAPDNPRALFIASMDALGRAKPGSEQQRSAFEQLRVAVKFFEATSATSVDTPGWGHAEAYLALGRELQSQGDLLGARNWIEKSLIAAPDFKSAQRQLALLVHR